MNLSIFLVVLLSSILSFGIGSANNNKDQDYSFEIIDGSYICNPISYIFGSDPFERYFKDDELCDGGHCVKLNKASKDFKHINVQVEVVHQTIEDKMKIKNRRKELGCIGEGGSEEYHCSKAWSGPVKFGFKFNGIPFYPSEKSFDYTSCIHQGDNIMCSAEDEEITFEIWHHFNSELYDEIGIPKPDLGINFYKGGFGYAEYKGSSQTSIIGRFYCEKFS